MSNKESTKMVKAISLAYKFLHQWLIPPYPSTARKKSPVSSSGSRVHFRVEKYSSGSSKKLFKRAMFCGREQLPYYSTQVWFPHINTWNKQNVIFPLCALCFLHCFSQVQLALFFSQCPPANLNLRISYNHMDALIMCCDCDPDPPNILESKSYVFCSKLHNYIIAICEKVAVSHSQGQRLFSGGKFTEVSVRRADHRRDFFHHKHLVSKVFAGNRCCFFGWKCDEESVEQMGGGQTGGHRPLQVQLWYFFPHCQRQLQLLRYLSLVL